MIATDHQPRWALAHDANVKDWEGQDDRAHRITPARARNARRVDVVCCLDRCASAPQRVVTLSLRGAEVAAGRLEFEEQRLTGADDQQVGTARPDAKRLEDRGFDWRSPAAVRDVGPPRITTSAPPQVLDQRALQLGFGLLAASHFGSHVGRRQQRARE